MAKDARQARLDACQSPNIALSPSGAYLAAICQVRLPPEMRKNSSHRPELVVWSMADGEELSRVPVESDSDYRVLWSSNEQFIGIETRFTQVFQWQSKKIVTNPVARTYSPDVGSTDLDITHSWLDMEGDVKVQSLNEGGLQAFRLSTGKAIPVKWRWRQDEDYTDMNWKMTLCPSRPGGPLHAIVAQEEERPRPRPTPVPTPTPTPTPVLSPEQRAFLEKEKILDEEVSQIVEKLQGDDPPPAEEAAQLEARGNSIVNSLRQERKRLFPVPKMPAAKLTAEPPLLANITRVDLKSGRVLWKKRIRITNLLPRMLFSQDGAVVAIIGVKRNNEKPDPPAYRSDLGRGIDFWLAQTGRTIGSATMVEEIERDRAEIHWLPSRVLFVHNGGSDTENEKMLFLHAHGARLLETRPIPKFKSINGKLKSIDGASVSADGRTWVFSSDRDGWFGYTYQAFRAGKEPYVKYH